MEYDMLNQTKDAQTEQIDWNKMPELSKEDCAQNYTDPFNSITFEILSLGHSLFLQTNESTGHLLRNGHE